MSHQRILDHTGRQLAEIELSKLWIPVGPCVGIARGELHCILVEGAAGVPMRLGTTLTTLSQEDDEVDVSFADGSTGTYDLVVGADGIHSSIRRLVFGSIHPRHLGQVSWRFLVDHVGAIDTWTAMLARRQAFLALPVGPNRLYCYADLASLATDDPTGRDLDRFRALFAQFADPVPRILGELESFDSIHLEDALVLAQMLARHGSPDEALSAFSKRRRPRIRWVQQRTHRRDRIRALPVPLRDLALRLAGTALYQRDYQMLFEQP
jgi:2-polyprenyl-6-methoxyphenol hydroxylase-like FAD-dependent oxidoreductase